MSSFPTPQSDRRRTLRSHSRAQASAPTEEETSDEGDITQYAEATNGSGRNDIHDVRRPYGVLWNARRNDNNTPADDLKLTIREYQKDIQKAMDTKAVTTFDGTNYQAWRVGILANAEVIGGTEILTKNQRVCPEGLDALDTEKWNIRTKALYRRMLQSLLGPVRTTIGALEPDNDHRIGIRCLPGRGAFEHNKRTYDPARQGQRLPYVPEALSIFDCQAQRAEDDREGHTP
ncbi:hypothetical protein ACJ73_05508 [Blastomyces percursus]|uniref:Uncharacterized protein n=1 Tax=Blastomyces percursus TaxID=1658174 RepID=A0A1J9QSD6_9EURO|nr:hypothetical protein ACJ73_05508 [Blastomyces percursus]